MNFIKWILIILLTVIFYILNIKINDAKFIFLYWGVIIIYIGGLFQMILSEASINKSIAKAICCLFYIIGLLMIIVSIIH